MSDTPKRPYDAMWPIARDLVERLRPYCQRIEIAGSLRRGKSLIGDIEIVAIPQPAQASFGGGIISQPYQLDARIEEAVAQGRVTIIRSGPKQKSLFFNLKNVGRVDVELWLQPDPATWGCNFMIRTGSADFAKWMVTSQGWGGAMPNELRFQDGRLWRVPNDMRFQGGQTLLEALRLHPLPTPEEADVFDALGLAWIPPHEREAGRWKYGVDPTPDVINAR